MSFSNRLKQVREAANMSQQELAELLEITPGTVSNYEKNVAYPRWDKILKLCDVLNVNPNYLFWDDLPERIKERILKASTNEEIRLYNQLDTEDKAEIRGEMKQMLKADKYKNVPTIADDLNDTISKINTVFIPIEKFKSLKSE